MARTVLVTGASGAIGLGLLRVLGQRGWTSRALVHRTPVKGADQTVRGDLANPPSLERATAGADAILHLAALTHARSARRYERANVDGTRALLEAARRQGVWRVVHVSTRAISPLGGGYSRSKRRAERLVEASELDYSIVRLPEVYGGGSREGVDRFLALAAKGRAIPVLGDGSHSVCPVFVDDAVAALAAALDALPARRRTYTLAGECVTMLELARTCVDVLGSRSRIRTVPILAAQAAALLSRALPVGLYPDQISRLRSPKPPSSPEARADLGFEPRPLASGLALAAERLDLPSPRR